jgi:serine/threonine protein kinase
VRLALRTAMGIPLVNLLCSPAFGTQKLHQTLAALSRLPVLEEDRAVLWLAMSSAIPPADRLAELEQIATDLGPAADDAGHAALWEGVVRMWLQEGLDGLPDDAGDLVRQLQRLLDAKHSSPAAFLTWRQLRVHVRRRPLDETILSPERVEAPASSRQRGPGVAEIMRQLATAVKIEPLVVKLKENGADEHPSPPKPPAPEPVEALTPPERPELPALPEQLAPPELPEPSAPRPLPLEALPLHAHTLLELARHRLCRGADVALAALDALRNAEARWVGAPLDPMCLLGVDEALGQALTALAAQRARLPARDEVETTAGAAEEIAASLGLALESPLPAPLVDALFRPDGLDRVRDACITAKRADASLPDWVWRGVTGGGARVAVIANDAAFHDELAACLSWAEEPSLAPLSGLQDLLDPGLGSLVERLRAANEERSAWRERETRFSGIALITSDEARARIASGWPETEPDLRTLEALLGRYKALSEALGADAREALRVHLCTSSPEAGADALDRVELLRSKASTTIVNLAFSQILEFAALMRPKTVPPPTTVMPNFSFGPPLSSKTNGGVHHGRGVYQQIESLEYGIVRFPVRLTFDEPLAARLELKFKLTRTSGDFVTPGQLASHEAPPVLDLPAGTSAHDFEIKVVLSRRFAEDMAVGKRKNLEVVVEGTGLGGKSCKTTLTWTALAMAMPELRDPIPQTVEPEEMLLCPLGVECHYDELLTHVRQGASSFFVYGPRRFGKTSLLRALDRFVDAGDVVLLRPAVASMRTLPALWNDIAAKFHERLGPARAHNSLEDGLLPFDYAYDSIREAAAERGIRAIYVLVDEAQAMFAHPRRVELAERLKERMEHAWMAVRQNGKLKRAAVLFGLIGQGHLPRLLTPNLRASLKEYERFEFSDEEILNLLRRTTGSDGLQSTKEAREHLAKLAGNLFILSKLLTEIRALCTKSQRTWFLRADVDRASAKLETAFREGEGAIWDWVRDPLNESDDRNDWRPSTAYPLALAWAGARARGEGGRTGAVALLRKLCPEAEPLEERINEVVEELRDLRVLDPRGEFKLPMLERLLTIRAESPRPLDDAERESAQRLGLRRVRRPPPERSDNDDSAAFEGGQAKIWRSTCNGRSAAVRAISLSDKTRSRARFIHEVALLRKIGEAGDQRVQVHLPRIFEMGIADDDPSQGLVIYEWIPGYPLPVESMTEPAVAEVGLQMADVLEVLERSGVVHRDIRPANVLLRVPTEEQASRAEIDVVLIDFGLARAVEHLRGGQRSIVEGVAEFIPPEVYGTSDSAAWSTAGDVYSTGVMLRKLLRQAPAADGAASSRQLRELLASMTARRPEDRPTAVGIRELFHAVVKSLESESKSTGLAELEAAVRSRVAKLPEPVRVSALDYLRSLVFIQAGMLTGVRRCAAVAAMLECAFRRVVRPQRPAPRNSPPPTYLRNARAMLSEARIEAPAWLDDQRMAAAGLLRNADHHPDDFNAIADRALGLLGSSISARDADARLLEALDHAARLVDELTHSRLVASFVGEVLRTGAPNGTPLHGQALRLA